MTYIIGIKRYGITTIIADTQISLIKSGKLEKSSRYSLKSGFLFKGCIYGASGAPDSIYTFLLDWEYLYKQYEYDENNREIPWVMFNTFIEVFPFHDIEVFPFHEHAPFSMIISSLAHGKPNLYLLKSHSQPRFSEVREDIVTIGSGTELELLDKGLKEFHRTFANRYCRPLTKDKEIRHYYPMIYCAWLMARIQGYDALELEKCGVGGYFHALIQMENGSTCQPPAVYVLYSIFPNYNHVLQDETGKLYVPVELVPSVYRIAFIRRGNMLVIDSSPSITERGDRHFIFNLWSQEELIEEFGNDLTEAEFLERSRATLENELNEQPLYTFCGFVFSDPKWQVYFDGFFRRSDSKQALMIERINNRWTISEERRKYIEDMLTRTLNAARSNPDKIEVRVFHTV